MARWSTIRRRSRGDDAVDRIAVDDWNLATYASPWQSDGTAGRGPARYWRDPWGVVHLAGAVETTAGVTVPSAIFALPKGYRPDYDLRLTGWMLVGLGAHVPVIDVLTTGEVRLAGLGGAASPATVAFLTLDMISFRQVEGEADLRLQR
jgi:hypothetical protein